METDELLTYKEAAKRSGYTERQLLRMVMEGRIPYTKRGRNTRFKKSELDEFCAAQDFQPEDAA